MTPLHNAVRERHTAIVQYLLENGARVDEKSEPGASALHYACFFSQLSSSYVTNTHTHNNGEDSSLKLETVSGVDQDTRNELDLFNLLLDRCPDLINEPDYVSGHTPLHVAAYFGKTQLFPLLLERGANPDIVDNDGENCFQVSVSDEVRVALEAAVEDLHRRQESILGRMKNPMGIDDEGIDVDLS
jgi:ankyrin repeat protein